jgi:hypothetical protein
MHKADAIPTTVREAPLLGAAGVAAGVVEGVAEGVTVGVAAGVGLAVGVEGGSTAGELDPSSHVQGSVIWPVIESQVNVEILSEQTSK